MDSIFEKLYSPKEETGFNETEIIKAEKRLGLDLPKSLRQFFLKFGRNNVINSCHYFEIPENLSFYDPDWLAFYGENQGVCFWAIKKEDFTKPKFNIYVNYEGFGYIKEANSFDDFLFIRSIDYAQVIFPYRMWSKNISPEDEQKVHEIFGYH